MPAFSLENRKEAFFILLIIAFSLRVYHLGYHDLWYDEAISVQYAHNPWANWNAPLYYILLHYWIKFFGISEFSLRLPSLIFSFLSVILILNLGKELFNNPKIGLYSAIFMSLSPLHLWYAQEARDYSMVLFFGLLSSYLLYKALNKDRLWLLFILVSIIGLYAHYFYIFLFITQGIYLLSLKKIKIIFKAFFYFLIIALGFLPYLPRFLNKLYFVWGGFWIPKPGYKSLVITLENFIFGYNGSHYLYLTADILMGILFISFFWALYKQRTLRQGIIFCLTLLFIPLVLAFFFSKLFFSVYLDRGLIIFSPYCYLVLSLGIVSLPKKIKPALIVFFAFLLLISDYRYFKDQMPTSLKHHMGTYIKKPIRPVVKLVEDNLGLQDAVAFANASTRPSFEFYSQKKPMAYYFFDPRVVDTNWQRPVVPGNTNIPLDKINSLNARRIWLIASNWPRDGGLDENSQAVKEWMDKNFALDLSLELEGLWISRYARF